MKKKTIEELDKELVLLKEKYSTVYSVGAPLNDDETEFATIFLRKIDRVTYASVGKLAMGNDPLRAVEAALKALYIGGDELKTILDNEDALMSCESVVVEILKKKEAVLKKN